MSTAGDDVLGPTQWAIEEHSNPNLRECAMGLDDKIRHKVEEGTGKAKEAVGRATDNERLEAEGRAEQAAAKAKEAGEHVRDAVEDATDALRDRARQHD
jgi:uncharacterized protein YjbJ (UPF0337 family)